MLYLSYQKAVQDRMAELKADANKYVTSIITQVCDKDNLSFYTNYVGYEVKNKAGEDVDSDIDELYNWYEEVFGEFPMCSYEDGVWSG